MLQFLRGINIKSKILLAMYLLNEKDRGFFLHKNKKGTKLKFTSLLPNLTYQIVLLSWRSSSGGDQAQLDWRWLRDWLAFVK